MPWSSQPRRVVVLGLATGLVATLVGCGADESARPRPVAAPEPLTVAVDRLPASFDPALASTVAERAIARAIQTPLLTYERRTDADAATLLPALASDLPTLSDDATEYRFTLRPGLLYADGRIVTASDVERSIAHASVRAADPALRAVLDGIVGAPSQDGQTLPGVRSDDRTGSVVVRLRRPDGRIPFALADPATAPLPELPSAGRAALPASTGPLRVARTTPDSVELVTNPLRARISSVPAARSSRVSVTSRAVTPSAVAVGTVDVDAQPSLASASSAPQASGDAPRTVTGGSGEVWSLLVPARGVFAERSARRVLMEAVDRRPLDRGDPATSGLTAACGLLPGYVVGADATDDCPPAPVRPARGQTGRTLRLAVPRPSGADGDRRTSAVLSVVRSAIEAVGFGSDVIERADPGAAAATGRADLAIVAPRPSLPHPEGWLEPVEPVDALLAREVPRLTAGPLTGTTRSWSDLERRAVDRAVAIPIATGRRTVLAAPGVSAPSVLLHPVTGLDLTALRAN